MRIIAKRTPRREVVCVVTSMRSLNGVMDVPMDQINDEFPPAQFEVATCLDTDPFGLMALAGVFHKRTTAYRWGLAQVSPLKLVELPVP